MKQLLGAYFSEISIENDESFPKLPRVREIYFLEPTDKGLIIGCEKAGGKLPANWSEVEQIAAALIPGRDDPVLKEVKDKLQKSTMLQFAGLSREERSKIFNDMLTEIDKLEIWQNALNNWLKLMNAEELKLQRKQLPDVILDIFIKPGRRYRLSAKTAIFSCLGDERTPNLIFNSRSMLGKITQHIPDTKLTSSAKAFIDKKVEAQMFFEFTEDFDNYLRWYFNKKFKVC